MNNKSHILFIKNNLFPVIWGLFLFFLITGFGWFFSDRSVFLLDYVPTPLYVRDWNHQLQQSGVRFLHNLLMYSLGYLWGSKIYLITIFFCSLGLGYARGKRLNKKLLQNVSGSVHQRAIMICMTLFVTNPFFSARYGTQPGVRLGIVLLGWALYFIVSRWGVRTKRDFCIISLCLGLAIMGMYHASFMVLFLLAVWFLFSPKKYRYIGLVGIGVLLLNSNWLLLNGSKTIATIETFTDQNTNEFATFIHKPWGARGTTALGYGFWGEKYGSAYTPSLANQQWGIAGVLLLAYGIYGMIIFTKYNKKGATFLCVLIFFSLLLGIGIASSSSARITNWLYEYLPGYRGFREPHKRIGLYMMVLLPMIVLGRGKSVSGVKKQFGFPVWLYAGVFILVVFARTPGVLNAMKGRYKMVNYPEAYQDTRSYILNADLQKTQRIHLPWHSYHQCDWTNKVISNSLKDFFLPNNIIVADNIEIGNLYTNSTNQRSQAIEQFLTTKEIAPLKAYGIGGILFTKKCGDFKNYERIKTLAGVQEIWSNDDIILFLIQ